MSERIEAVEVPQYRKDGKRTKRSLWLLDGVLCKNRGWMEGDVVFFELTLGKVTKFNRRCLEQVAPYKWYAHKSAKVFYARAYRQLGGVPVTIFLHHLIINPPAGKEADHADRDGLNNLDTNLRHATPSQNCRNRQRARTVSRFRGLRKNNGRFEVRLNTTENGTRNRRHVHLAQFGNPLTAAICYDQAAWAAYGEFAILNWENYDPFSFKILIRPAAIRKMHAAGLLDSTSPALRERLLNHADPQPIAS